MNVFVTGGAGFIGSKISKRFVDDGYSVVILDNLFRGKIENIKNLIGNGATLEIIDLADFNNIPQIAKLLIEFQPAYIMHYAAINGTQYFYDIPEAVAEVNSVATLNMMKAITIACQSDINYKPFIVFASTSETYGEPFKIPTTEEDITYARIAEDRDSYAIAKLMSEFYIKLFCKKNSIDYIIFRIFNVYGPNMVGSRYGQVIPEFVERLTKGEYPLNILGDGTHTRSFIHIDDHVELTLRALKVARRNEVYNLGNPHEISINELATLIMTTMGMDPRFIHTEERSGDHRRRVPDIRKLLSYVGHFNFISIEDGIERLVK